MRFYDAIVIDNGYKGTNDNVDIIDLSCSKKTASQGENDHGSLIVDMIINNISTTKVLVLKICEDYTDFTEEDLCMALEYIINHDIICNVLNISLGVTKLENYNLLNDLISKLNENNIVIVAAYHPFCMSYPAALKGVVGVDTNDAIENVEDYVFNINNSINIVGSGRFLRIKQKNGKVCLRKGSSFVAAYISKLLVSLLHGSRTRVDNHKKATFFLQENAKCINNYPRKKENKGKYFLNDSKHAIVLPFNKEIHAIAMNEDLLCTQVDNYYDFDISLNLNRAIDEILPFSRNKKIVRSWKNINWKESFDTVILGHCKEYERMTKKSLYDPIISMCKLHNKKLYAFDDCSFYSINGELCDYYCPEVHPDMVERGQYNKLFDYSTPILAVMGTSSVQGKYSLQLSIRRELQKQGYRVANIGTEPTGYLFGFDYVLPMGYGSRANLSSYEFVSLLNSAINEAEQHLPDIIVIGSQSGTISLYRNNLSFMLFRQYELLQASSPDAVVLCVNSFDDVDYIEKTIRFIESSTESKVISLVVSPLKEPSDGILRANRELLSESEIIMFSDLLKTRFQIPVFLLGTNIDKIGQVIVDYFS